MTSVLSQELGTNPNQPHSTDLQHSRELSPESKAAKGEPRGAGGVPGISKDMVLEKGACSLTPGASKYSHRPLLGAQVALVEAAPSLQLSQVAISHTP